MYFFFPLCPCVSPSTIQVHPSPFSLRCKTHGRTTRECSDMNIEFTPPKLRRTDGRSCPREQDMGFTPTSLYRTYISISVTLKCLLQMKWALHAHRMMNGGSTFISLLCDFKQDMYLNIQASYRNNVQIFNSQNKFVNLFWCCRRSTLPAFFWQICTCTNHGKNDVGHTWAKVKVGEHCDLHISCPTAFFLTLSHSSCKSFDKKGVKKLAMQGVS